VTATNGSTPSRTGTAGDGGDVLNAGYAKLLEIPATTGEEACERVIAMAQDGSLERLQADRNRDLDSAHRQHASFLADQTAEELYRHARDEEMRPGQSIYDGMERPAIPLTQE
jgi:hypothetical protein